MNLMFIDVYRTLPAVVLISEKEWVMPEGKFPSTRQLETIARIASSISYSSFFSFRMTGREKNDEKFQMQNLGGIVEIKTQRAECEFKRRLMTGNLVTFWWRPPGLRNLPRKSQHADGNQHADCGKSEIRFSGIVWRVITQNALITNFRRRYKVSNEIFALYTQLFVPMESFPELCIRALFV